MRSLLIASVAFVGASVSIAGQAQAHMLEIARTADKKAAKLAADAARR